MGGFKDTSYTLTISNELGTPYYVTSGVRIRASITIPFDGAMDANLEITNADANVNKTLVIGHKVVLQLADGVMINGYVFSFQVRHDGTDIITTIYVSSTFTPMGVKRLKLSVKKGSGLTVLLSGVTGLGELRKSVKAEAYIAKTTLKSSEVYDNVPLQVLRDVCNKHNLVWTMVQAGEVMIFTKEERFDSLDKAGGIKVSYKDDTLVGSPTINTGFRNIYDTDKTQFQTVTVKCLLDQGAQFLGQMTLDAQTFNLADGTVPANLTSASGIYTIGNITHSIDTYSMEWFSTLEGWTKND